MEWARELQLSRQRFSVVSEVSKLLRKLPTSEADEVWHELESSNDPLAILTTLRSSVRGDPLPASLQPDVRSLYSSQGPSASDMSTLYPTVYPV